VFKRAMDDQEVLSAPLAKAQTWLDIAETAEGLLLRG
jgi:hypothetical protein